MHQTLPLDKLEGGDYKHDNSFSIFQSKDADRTFFSSKTRMFFALDETWSFHEFEGAD